MYYTCFNEMRRKEERSKQCQTNNKAKQHSTAKAVTFPMYMMLCISMYHNMNACPESQTIIRTASSLPTELLSTVAQLVELETCTAVQLAGLVPKVVHAS